MSRSRVPHNIFTAVHFFFVLEASSVVLPFVAIMDRTSYWVRRENSNALRHSEVLYFEKKIRFKIAPVIVIVVVFKLGRFDVKFIFLQVV